MAPFTDKKQNKNHHETVRGGAQAFRLIGVLCALMLASACANSVRVSANGARWGAPVSANIRLSGRHHRHHHNRSGQQTPYRGDLGDRAGQKIGRPYQVAGRTYVPARQDDYDRTGVASWYGSKFQGRKTANGEHFDMNALSAAHTTLPLPSLVRVTNLNNGRSIIVRVNDRGPFVNNRLIDLSRAGAEELGYLRQGTARVRVQYVGPAVNHAGRSVVRRASSRGRRARVWPASAKTSVAVAAPAPSQQAWPDDSRDKYPIALSRPRISLGGWFVQVGAFSERVRAARLAADLRGLGNTSVQTAWINRRYIHRVLVGPYPDRARAEREQRVVADAGYPQARVSEQK